MPDVADAIVRDELGMRENLYALEGAWTGVVKPGVWLFATLVVWGGSLFAPHLAVIVALETAQHVGFLLPFAGWRRKRRILARLQPPKGSWYILPAPPKWAGRCAALSILVTILGLLAVHGGGQVVAYGLMILARLFIIWRWMSRNSFDAGRAALAELRRDTWLHVEATDEAFDARLEVVDVPRGTIQFDNDEERWVVAAGIGELAAILQTARPRTEPA